MIFRIFIQSLCDYPKGTALILIALLNLAWLSCAVLFARKYRTRVFRIYFFYAVSALIWVVSNAYFQSGLLLHFGEDTAKDMAITANIASSFAAISFYWLASAMRRTGKHSPFDSALFICFLTAVALTINLAPGFTVKYVRLFTEATDGARFELIFGKGNVFFFVSGFTLLIAAFTKFIRAVKTAHDRVENTRYYYILFAMSVMYGSMILFHMILPSVFGNYDYVWLPPLLTVLQVLIIGYAVITRRFIDIALLASRLTKLLIAFSLAVGVSFIIFTGAGSVFPSAPLPLLFALIISSALCVFWGAMRFFGSFAFYRYFGAAASEHCRRMVKDIKNRDTVYTSARDFERDIRKSFKTYTDGIRPRIITLDRKNRKKLPNLIRYFRENSGILVTEEVKYTENEQDKMIPFLKELESLGGVCLPLRHPLKGLVGLFSLGEKNYNHLYTREEISAFEDMGAYLSFMITGILYNAELEDEVRIKTAEIRKKTVVLKNQVSKLKTMFDRQADFVAVTAHEVRTPLSIALFQAADLMSEEKSKTRREQAKTLYDSLSRLKELFQNVFTVQQLDLDKVDVHKERTDMKAFVENTFNDFRKPTKESGPAFFLENNLKAPVYAEIDPSKLNEAVHHLLDNARKFTPQTGRVILQLKADKKEIAIEVHDSGEGIPKDKRTKIFEKYGTNHNAQGIGLGLYICKKLTDLNNGRIHVKTSKFGGAAFVITLKRIV